MKNSRQLL
jgi:hypothetical protein